MERFLSNLSLGQWLLTIQTVAAADHLVFLWGRVSVRI